VASKYPKKKKKSHYGINPLWDPFKPNPPSKLYGMLSLNIFVRESIFLEIVLSAKTYLSLPEH